MKFEFLAFTNIVTNTLTHLSKLRLLQSKLSFQFHTKACIEMVDTDEGNNKGNGKSSALPSNTDTSSFSSILANVAKMREQAGGDLQKDNLMPQNLNNSVTIKHSTALPHQNANIYSERTEFRTARQVHHDKTQSIRSGTQRRVKQVIVRGQSGQKSSYEATRHAKLRKQTFSSIQVNKTQNGNPLLTFLTDVSYKFNGQIHDVDYLVNSHCFAVFLSIKYHKLHPEYIYHKIKKIGYNPSNKGILRLMLVLVDVESSDDAMRELNKLCLLNNLTLIAAWSFEQCADYLTSLKQCEMNTAKGMIQGNSKRDDDMDDDLFYYKRVVETLTTVKAINKTDAINLVSHFGSLEELCQKANEANLQEIPGMGQRKIKQLLKVINDPFLYK